MKNLCVPRKVAQKALVVSFSVGFVAPGFAHSNGQVLASGKNGGFYCRNCHAGGTVPTVSFDGPKTMDPGSTATFSFVVTSHAASQIAAGLDVAANGGTLGLVAGQGTRVQQSEVTHSEPKANDVNGQAIFEFTWQAPANTGTYTLFGAGCSVDGNSQQGGDAAARTTYEIVVGAAGPSPTPTDVPVLRTPTATGGATGTPTTNGKTCVGDCGGDKQVTVDELIAGVNIALGVTPVSACLVFDANDDGEVTVSELVQAVSNALTGCPVQEHRGPRAGRLESGAGGWAFRPVSRGEFAR